MTDIAHYVPEVTKTVSAIYKSYEEKAEKEEDRGYLGASVLGHYCERYLWYAFRFCCKPNFNGRIYRLFDSGNKEEERLIADLRSIGCTVSDKNEIGKQYEVNDLGGHLSGHLDAAAIGIPEAPKTWHVLEFKTHNEKSFNDLKKHGVRVSKKQHHYQMQIYMHLTGMKRALYLAVNKNTDELYSERIEYDKELSLDLLARARRIIFDTLIPGKISNRQDWYECKFCDAYNLCWGIGEACLPIPAIHCRQCCHATPTLDGKAKWICELHKKGLSKNAQKRACEDHLILPDLISFAFPSNYGKDDYGEFIEFNILGKQDTFLHGKGPGRFSTKELTTIPISALTNSLITSAKEKFNAEATGYCTDDILHRYPESDTRIIWKGALKELPQAWLDHYHEDFPALDAIHTCDATEYKAAEFTGGRVVIVWNVQQIGSKDQCEIREGIK